MPEGNERPDGLPRITAKPFLRLFSIGPDDSKHPGLPAIQAERLVVALAYGVRVMRGMAWLGLPTPLELRDPNIFVHESKDEKALREEKQIYLHAEICEHGVGKKIFDAAGGWQVLETGELYKKKFEKSCAEWSDGEFVAAHISYGNDIICTEDRGVGAGHSVFDATNRQWLAEKHGMGFATLSELAGLLKT